MYCDDNYQRNMSRDGFIKKFPFASHNRVWDRIQKNGPDLMWAPLTQGSEREPFYFLNTSINLSCLGRNYKVGGFSYQGHQPQHCWLLFPNIPGIWTQSFGVVIPVFYPLPWTCWETAKSKGDLEAPGRFFCFSYWYNSTLIFNFILEYS